MAPGILFFQKSNVFVCRCPADVADPCQFGHIQVPLPPQAAIPDRTRLGHIRNTAVPLGMGNAHSLQMIDRDCHTDSPAPSGPPHKRRGGEVAGWFAMNGFLTV